MTSSSHVEKSSPRDSSATFLAVVGAIQLAICAAITIVSSQFTFEGPGESRPIFEMVSILIAAHLVYLTGVWIVLHTLRSNRLTPLIFVIAVAMRLALFPSEPIQEVDYYRYMWDGIVAKAGVSPFRFAPADLDFDSAPDARSAELQALVTLRNQDPAIATIHGRVHYPELPTVYPPVSQVLFAASQSVLPVGAPLFMRVMAIKSVIVAFDLGTIISLSMLLRTLRLPTAWTIVYAWCPLVLKEFANSSHLDSVAVFFTVTGLWLLLSARSQADPTRFPARLLASAIVWGLGVGAKLFPVVLFPVIAVYCWRNWTLKSAIIWSLAALLTSAIALSPMAMIGNHAGQSSHWVSSSWDGLSAFLSRWEMNDLIFMVVEENLRPAEQSTTVIPAWFAVTPDPFRKQIVELCATQLSMDSHRVPFSLARLITMSVFGIIAIRLCWLVWRNALGLAEAMFLTLVWLWLLGPAQNPWYWTWAIPFLPFSNNRAWLLMAGFSFLYYLRFWFQFHPTALASFGGSGPTFFDFVVVWIEYVPVLVLVSMNWCRQSVDLRRFPRWCKDSQSAPSKS